MALTAGLGALLGGLNSTQANRTTQTGSTTTPGYTPQQTALQTQALGTISNGLSDPNAAFKPIEASGIDTINQGYSGTLDAMNRELASRGFTSSGTTGFNTEKVLSSRAGAIGNFEGNLASEKLGQQNTLLSDALGAAYKPASTSTTGYSIAPGSTTAGAFSGGITSLMQALNQAFAGGGA